MSNNGSINDALDKAQRGLLDFLSPALPLLRARGGPGAAVRGVRKGVAARAVAYADLLRPWPRRCITRARVRDALLAFKFKRRIEDLNSYGVLMAEAAEVYADGFDAVTWVPVSRKRLQKRGFDQARMLCASLCVDWHTEPQETLRKVRDNPAQSGLGDPAARRANVLGVYEPVDPEAITGKRFCSSTTSSPPAPRSASASGC